jgi:rubrerythrin
MPLTNFGSVLNFAEELEKQDLAFYEAAAANPACQANGDLFKAFIADAQKNVKNVQRTRRENVTEMILEPIEGFTRDPFVTEVPDATGLDAAGTVAAARQLEERAESYYAEAAKKIKALPEVSRALKQVGKKRTAHIKKLAAL